MNPALWTVLASFAACVAAADTVAEDEVFLLQQKLEISSIAEGAHDANMNSSITVLVTGGAGFIGSHAVLALLELGYRVIVLDNLSRGYREAVLTLAALATPGRFQFYDTDLGDASGVQRILVEEKPAAVMHFAGVAFPGESVSDPLRYYQNNTANTILLAKAMKDIGIRNLIYSSSCATYGLPDHMPVTEETPQIPLSPYGWSKLQSERVLKDFWAAQDQTDAPFKIAVLRYFNVVGADPKGRLGERRPKDLTPGSKAYYMRVRISQALFDAAEGVTSEFRIAGSYATPDGTALRDYVHVSDLVAAHIATLKSMMDDGVDLPTLRYYNVGGGKPASVLDLITAVKNVTGVNFSTTYGDARAGDPAQIWTNNDKIFREVGWKPKHSNITETLGHAWLFQQSLNKSGHM